MRRAVGAMMAASAVLAVALAGCGPQGAARPESSPTSTPSPSPSPTPTSTPSPIERPSLVAHWTDPFELALPNGWTARECLGDAPDLCVYDGDMELGNVELAGYPRDDHELGADDRSVAVGRAESFVRHFSEDRAQGCPDFTFAADDVTDAIVGGQPAARTAFTLTDGDGRVVERVIVHFTVAGQTVWLVNTDAYAEQGGCLPPSETDLEFLPEHLADFEPYLDDLVADTPLPPAEEGG